MAGKGGTNVKATLEKFRQQQAKAAEVLVEVAEERQKRQKLAAGQAGMPRANKPAARAPRARPAASGEGAPAGSGPSGSGAGGAADWKTGKLPAKAGARQQQAPLGMRVKAVVDYLRSCGQPAHPAEIYTQTGVNPATDAKVATELERNPKVCVEHDGTFSYIPEVANVKNKEQLLEYMRRREREGEGFACLKDLSDAYSGVEADLQALQEAGSILALFSYDPHLQCEVYYPVDARMELHADADIVELWQRVGGDMPDDDDELAAEVKKIGQQPAPRKAARKRTKEERKRKPRKARRLTKVTNVHLKHLFEGDAPTQID